MIAQRHLLVAGTFLLAVLLYVDRICISTAQAQITSEVRLTDKEFGWVLSAFALGYALFQTPAGQLADRFGPRRVLTCVVTLWSMFTGITATAASFTSLLVIRFLFGAGEAGGFPGIARATFSWIPMAERGTVQGINFSGGRLGAAFALPVVAWWVETIGWRETFYLLMAIGFVWAAGWYRWFRDDPSEHPGLSRAELELIHQQRQEASVGAASNQPLLRQVLFGSRNLWLAMAQYFSSNFTFFFCLTWLFPHLKQTYQLTSLAAGWYASAPLLAGALGNLVAGWLVDRIYRHGHWKLSRQAPAMAGFALAAIGLVASVYMQSALGAVFWLSVAIFGADMTLSPSWSFCIDIGRERAGAVSGTMNMAGNIGSFVTSLAFPYLLAWTGSAKVFFFVGAGLNVLAIAAWWLIRLERK